MVFCDFQKAYDRVRWSWLWSVLTHIGLGDRFLRLVQACYASPVVTLLLEGVSLGEVTHTRGVRQGCPLSPLLFALCIEPLHQALRTRPNITGTPLPNRADNRWVAALKALLFADDITLFPLDERDLRQMVGVIREFGHASGAALNAAKTFVLQALAARGTTFGGLTILKGEAEVKSLGIIYGAGVSRAHQWARFMVKMRERVRRWRGRGALTVLGRVAVANALVTSVACYMAAFTTPTTQQLKEMDDMVWSLVWDKDLKDGTQRRGGWLSLEKAQLPTKEGGLGLLLPSALIASRQAAMVGRALRHKEATWTIFLEQWLCEWGGEWVEGWDGVLIQPPKQAPTQWADAVRVWQRVQWEAPAPETAWEARAAPLWAHPAMHTARALRANHRGALELAKVGVRRVDDLWDAGKRQWRPLKEVLAPVPFQQRFKAAEALKLVYGEVEEWVGDGMAVLTEAPHPPAPGSWWWDEERVRGGQVVETRPCKHADGCFGGFDVVLAPQPRYEWVMQTEEERAEGLLPAARALACGYEGAPVTTHPPVKPGQRGSLGGVSTQEGLRADRWRGATGPSHSMTPTGTSKQYRSAMAHGRRKSHSAHNQSALERWRRWAPGDLSDNLWRALRQARRLPGLKAKVQQLCLKMMWRRVGLRGPEGPTVCGGCGAGEGAGVAEEHIFFTCPQAVEVWSMVSRKLALSGGLLHPRSVSDLTCTPAAPLLGGSGCTRTTILTVWVGALWAIWRKHCAQREERTLGPRERDGSIWCGEIWRAVLKARWGRVVESRGKQGGLVKEVMLAWAKWGCGVRAWDRGGGWSWVMFDDGG